MSVRTPKICITSSDIARIEGCSMRTASQKMLDMKLMFKKTAKHHKVTFTDYSKYTKIPLEELEQFRY
jgi:hypothetical protein